MRNANAIAWNVVQSLALDNNNINKQEEKD